jgi:soluble lytic murein transglycosylase-like protein
MMIRQHGWRHVLASTALAALLTQGLPGAGAAFGVKSAAAQDAAEELSAATLGSGSTASLPGDMPEVLGAALPNPLDPVDADRYRQIFRRQAAGDFAGADRLIGSLTDPLLLGHVLADRYLSPDYKSKVKELSEWMAAYPGHPQAKYIYRLALKKGASEAALKSPKFDITRVGTPDESTKDTDQNWRAGLAAWGKRDYPRAAAFFEKAARQETLSEWERSAAAYWAARAHVRAQQPQKVSEWLKLAAAAPRTFYGQLATRALGLEPSYDWRVPTLNTAHGDQLMKSRTGQRALGLLQVGQTDLAEKELLILQGEAGDEFSDALLAISQSYRLPSLALKIGTWHAIKGGERRDSALYPLPSWKPAGGFKVDPALLYAIMRQESGFNPNAISSAGATGLMQLMPATAKAIGAPDSASLKDPLVSLKYGEKYIERLLAEPAVGGDLFLMAISYNAGPGNLIKWKQSIKGSDDPLFFIENIPSQETRNFVERVISAYWVYQARLGQPQRSLEAVANGAWPTYQKSGGSAVVSN